MEHISRDSGPDRIDHENQTSGIDRESSHRLEDLVTPELRKQLGLDQEQKNQVVLELDREDGVAILRLGSSNEKIVTFNEERIKSIRQAIETIKVNPPEALVITGSGSGMFAAGADITAFKDVNDPGIGTELAKEGQALFQEIESLPCKTVTAISGPCLGGGCELALATDYRIMSSHPKSVIGLPETKLGILPGWGGTQRLGRLLGVRKAIELITAGKVLKPVAAYDQGLVDEVVAPDELEDRAIEAALGKTSPHELSIPPRFQKKFPFVDPSWLAEKSVHKDGLVGKLANKLLGKQLAEQYRKGAQAMARKKTKGHYPAIPASIDSIVKGLGSSLEEGLDFEAEQLGDLIVSPESKSLQHVFFLTEASKGLGKAASQEMKNADAVIIGAGTMGAGIAATLARSGSEVLLKDISEEQLAKAEQHIEKGISRSRSLSAEAQEEILARVSTSTEHTDLSEKADIAIEAIVERMDIKKAVLKELSERLPDDAVLATNTSSLSITEMAEAVDNPERVVGMHFFNPVERMPLVEIVRGEKTSDETVDRVAALTTQMGKFPIVVQDVPGFLVNRILVPYLNEASYLLEDGYSIQQIDAAAKNFGMPMGPVRLLDEIGLDVASKVGQIMHDAYGDRMATLPTTDSLVDSGLLGKKSGEGFYKYEKTSKGKPKETPSDTARQALGLDSSGTRTDDYELQNIDGKIERFGIVEKRLVLRLVNEAVRCLDEGVAGPAGEDAAKQIDLGTVMGFGFPPFRGGIIRYAESLGAERLLKELEIVGRHSNAEERFTPAEGIVRRAAEGKSFYEALD